MEPLTAAFALEHQAGWWLTTTADGTILGHVGGSRFSVDLVSVVRAPGVVELRDFPSDPQREAGDFIEGSKQPVDIAVVSLTSHGDQVV